ncbi:MAG TPA: N-acetyltransferase [Gaiellaceae bacterium]|nr:N-acetyltransferase [Gaiellaceae bacterium]
MIRPATPDDAAAIHDVHLAAFGREYEARIPGEVDPVISLVAEEDGEVVGHVLVSWFGLEGSERGVLGLGPIGVLPAHQGRGIGSALVRAALDGARGLGEPVVVLEGNPAYYARFGFVRGDEVGLLPPPSAPERAFQAAVLDEAALPEGRVVYPPAFAP